MKWSTKIELNPANALSADVWKLTKQLDARKIWELCGA